MSTMISIDSIWILAHEIFILIIDSMLVNNMVETSIYVVCSTRHGGLINGDKTVSFLRASQEAESAEAQQ